MANSPRSQERDSPSLQASPKTPTSSNGSNTAAGAGASAVTPPLTPKTLARSETSPYPITFIHTDTSGFKQVVQMLTGCAEAAPKNGSSRSAADLPSKNPIPPAKTGPKKPGFKLYERRSSHKNLKLSPLMPSFLNSNSVVVSGGGGGFSPRNQPEILSPSMLNFPSLALSPVTPLARDPFLRQGQSYSSAGLSAEDRAIAEKGFYLHPSPRTTPREAEPPRLLPLFPVTSPRVSSGSPLATS